MLSKCWAPCFTLNSGYLGLEKGSRLIAIYTATTHVVFIFYGIWILCGGQSDTFFSPFFEFSRKNMYVLAGLLIVYCIGYIVIGSLGLIHAIRSVRIDVKFDFNSQREISILILFRQLFQETRFYYLPWLYCTLVEILFFSGFGIYILYRYYHNVSKHQFKFRFVLSNRFIQFSGMVSFCRNRSLECVDLSLLPLSCSAFPLLCIETITRTNICCHLSIKL